MVVVEGGGGRHSCTASRSPGTHSSFALAPGEAQEGLVFDLLSVSHYALLLAQVQLVECVAVVLLTGPVTALSKGHQLVFQFGDPLQGVLESEDCLLD